MSKLKKKCSDRPCDINVTGPVDDRHDSNASDIKNITFFFMAIKE